MTGSSFSAMRAACDDRHVILFRLLSRLPCRYVDEFSSTAGRPEFREKENPDEQIVGHPVQAFQLIKRLTIDFKELRSLKEISSARSEYT